MRTPRSLWREFDIHWQDSVIPAAGPARRIRLKGAVNVPGCPFFDQRERCGSRARFLREGLWLEVRGVRPAWFLHGGGELGEGAREFARLAAEAAGDCGG